MSSKGTCLLSVEGLSAAIGGQTILHDVGLDIDQGECVAVVGGSGAGKSTLLRCLLGLYRPARPVSGRLTFDGQSHDMTARRRINLRRGGFAFVPQNPQAGLDPLRPLGWQWSQAVRCACGRVRVQNAKAGKDGQAVLEALKLNGFGKRYPHHWSQGMQQRLLIAFALLSRPKVLVLDEPTSALDPIIAARAIQEVMAYADAHGISVLVVTHDLALAAKFARRTAVMANGRVSEFSPTGTLLANPQSETGRLLVANRFWQSESLPQGGARHGQMHTGAHFGAEVPAC